MNEHHDLIKHTADVGAWGVTLLSIASHFAEVASPIATLVLTLMSILWLGIRFVEWGKAKLSKSTPDNR